MVRTPPTQYLHHMHLIKIGMGALVLASLTACSFSMSAGGPDYDKLQTAITDELNTSYAEIGQQVTGVECPRQSDLKTGDTFICTADLDANEVRVEVTVDDDDGNVSFSTLDVVYNLPTVAESLATDITADRGFDVTVDCGEGLKVVAIGDAFECTAADESGETRQVQVTAGPVGEGDSWKILEN